MNALQEKNAYNKTITTFFEECSDKSKFRFTVAERVKGAHDVHYVRGTERIFAARVQSLHKCASQDNVDGVLYFLVSRNVDIDSFDDFGETALQRAAHHGSANAVRQLAASGANLDLASREKGWTAVHYAANSGHPSIVKQLFDAGADTTTKDKAGFTAAHLACQCNQVPVLQTLFLCQPPLPGPSNVESRVACLCLPSANGLTPVHVAAQFDSLEALRFLIRSGCEPFPTDAFGETPLHKAASGGAMACYNLLAKLEVAGGEKDRENDQGDTPANLLQSCVRYFQSSKDESGPSQVAIQRKLKDDARKEGTHLFVSNTIAKTISYVGTDRKHRTPAEMRKEANLLRSELNGIESEKKPPPPPRREGQLGFKNTDGGDTGKYTNTNTSTSTKNGP